MNYKRGTPVYDDYYSRNPQKKQTDEALRAMPQLGSEGTATYDPVNSSIADAAFRFLADIKQYSEGEVQPRKDTAVHPTVMTERIKGIAKFYNAKLVGITKMQEYHYYSHRGRPDEHYGKKIDRYHKYGICLASCPFSDEIPKEYVEKLKTSKSVRKEILENHERKHGIRPYIKDKPEWL
jgi:hypothetical protein